MASLKKITLQLILLQIQSLIWLLVYVAELSCQNHIPDVQKAAIGHLVDHHNAWFTCHNLMLLQDCIAGIYMFLYVPIKMITGPTFSSINVLSNQLSGQYANSCWLQITITRWFKYDLKYDPFQRQAKLGLVQTSFTTVLSSFPMVHKDVHMLPQAELLFLSSLPIGPLLQICV